MKKRICLGLVLLLSFVLLTGCMTVDYRIDMQADGTAAISYDFLMDNSAIEQLGGVDGEAYQSFVRKESLQQQGYTVEDITTETQTGVHVTEPVGDVTFEGILDRFEEDVLYAFGSGYSLQKGFDVQKGFLFDVYRMDAGVDMKDVNYGGVDITLTITTPAAPQSNGTADGNSVTWKLVEGENNQLVLEYRVLNMQGLIICIVIGVVLLLAIIALIVILILRRKKKTAQIMERMDFTHTDAEEAVQDAAEDSTDTVQEAVEEGQEAAEAVAEEVQETVEAVEETVEEAAEAVEETAEETAEEAQEAVEETAEEVQEAAQDEEPKEE